MNKYACFMLLVLSGCTLKPAYYNQNNLALTELAVLKGKTMTFQDSLSASIVSVFDESGERVVGNASLIGQDAWHEVYLEPGAYQVVLRCDTGFIYSHPRIAIDAKASTEYSLSCKINYEKDKILGIDQAKTMSPVVESRARETETNN